MKTTDSTTLPDDIESLKALVLSLQGESKKYQQLYYETLEKWQGNPPIFNRAQK
jgi:hypothetical protein